MDQGFSRERILRGNRAFQQVRLHGARTQSHYLSLGYLHQPESTLKVGFITPKHLGKAHDRNLIRRRLREILAHSPLTEDLPYWLVLIARNPAKNASYQQLQKHWHKVAERAQLPKFTPPAR